MGFIGAIGSMGRIGLMGSMGFQVLALDSCNSIPSAFLSAGS
jgi:hypothetical protein